MFQRACTDSSISDTVLELRPMFMMRLADETGCSSTGGLDTLGSAWAWVRRSCTIWRACIRLVPGAKNISIADRPVIDSDSIDCSQGTPFSRSASSGTVISDSTSEADRPSASVCTSSDSGENSGTTSSDKVRMRHSPPNSSAAASASTMACRRKLEETIPCSMVISRSRKTVVGCCLRLDLQPPGGCPLARIQPGARAWCSWRHPGRCQWQLSAPCGPPDRAGGKKQQAQTTGCKRGRGLLERLDFGPVGGPLFTKR